MYSLRYDVLEKRLTVFVFSVFCIFNCDFTQWFLYVASVKTMSVISDYFHIIPNQILIENIDMTGKKKLKNVAKKYSLLIS